MAPSWCFGFGLGTSLDLILPWRCQPSRSSQVLGGAVQGGPTLGSALGVECAKPSKPRSGGERIQTRFGDAAGVCSVPVPVFEDLNERVADFARGLQRVAVPAIGPEAATSE